MDDYEKVDEEKYEIKHEEPHAEEPYIEHHAEARLYGPPPLTEEQALSAHEEYFNRKEMERRERARMALQRRLDERRMMAPKAKVKPVHTRARPVWTAPETESDEEEEEKKAAPMLGIMRALPSSKASTPEVIVGGEYEPELERAEFVKHYQTLDNRSKQFLEDYFPGKADVYSAVLGSEQILKLSDDDFYHNLIEDANNMIRNDPNYTKMMFGGAELVETPNLNQRELQLAKIIDMYNTNFDTDRLKLLMNYDKDDKILDRKDIERIYSVENLHAIQPDVIARKYLEQMKPKDVDLVDKLNNAIRSINHLDAELKQSLITVEDYEKIYGTVVDDVEDALIAAGGKNFFESAMNENKIKNVLEMNRFWDYVNGIKAIVKSKPNNTISIALQSKINQVEQDLKDGRIIDLHEAYQSLQELDPIKESILKHDLETIKYEYEEKTEPESIQPDLKSSYDFYEKARKANLFAYPGIELKGVTKAIPNEDVYFLDAKKAEQVAYKFKDVLDDTNFLAIDFKDDTSLPDENVIDTIEVFVKKLDAAGIKINPVFAEILQDINNKAPLETIREHAEQFKEGVRQMNLDMIKLADDKKFNETKMKKEITKEFDKIEDDPQYKLLETDTSIATDFKRYSNLLIEKTNLITEDYRLKIDDAKTQEEKDNLIEHRNRELKQMREEAKKQFFDLIKAKPVGKKLIEKMKLKEKIEQKAKNYSEAVIKRAITNLRRSPPSKIIIGSKKVTKPRFVSVPAPPPIPKIVITKAEAEREKHKRDAFNKGLIYAAEHTKHEPEKGKTWYGKYTIEFKPHTKEDLKEMINDIRRTPGELFIVDLRNGRLFPIKPAQAYPKAVYIYHIDPMYYETTPNLEGGAFVEPKKKGRPKKEMNEKRDYTKRMTQLKRMNNIHGTTAWYPALDRVLSDQEILFPYEFMRYGNDKILQTIHNLPRKKHNRRHLPFDYRTEHRRIRGGSLWKHIKKGLKAATIDAARNTGNYIANKTVDAAKDLAKQSVYEAKHFVAEEKKNINTLYKAGKQIGKDPSLANIGKAGTSLGKIVLQPTISTARELANVSDFAGRVPGLNVAKNLAEFAIPGLAVADAAVHGIKNIDEGNYLDAGINAVDGVIGSGKLSGLAEFGTRVLGVGMKVADKFVDDH